MDGSHLTADASSLLEELGNLSFSSVSCQKDNIFRIFGIETKEVLICRFLAFLLSPCSMKELGAAPLKLFLEALRAKAYTEDQLSSAGVFLEEIIENDRRVDLVIRIAGDLYPFEVKIRAGDQDAQLCDYYRFYEHSSWNTEHIYYLTPGGWPPGKQSLRDLPEDRVQCLSFSNHIFSWVQQLLQVPVLKPEHKKLLQDFMEVICSMSVSAAHAEEIMQILNIDRDGIRGNQKLEALLWLLSQNKESFWERIRKEYLKQSLLFGGVALSGILTLEEPGGCPVDKALYAICCRGKPVAWICVDWNLYIVSLRRTERICSTMKDRNGNSCYWAYLTPDSREYDTPFHLKSPNPEICRCPGIELQDYLEPLICDFE